MKLGAFSVSLAVKDLNASLEFYEKLGFEAFAGDKAQNFLMMKNGDTVVGLFQGMFESNILTFNPKWNQQCVTQTGHPDVRRIYQAIKDAGIATEQECLDSESGPGSFVMIDPDGNAILIDQHVE